MREFLEVQVYHFPQAVTQGLLGITDPLEPVDSTASYDKLE